MRSEAAVVESAQGRPWEVLGLAGAVEALYLMADARPQEAAYRLHRTRYRLAIAYRVWRSGEPYCPPYRGPHHAPEAQVLLRGLLSEVAPLAGSADRYALLG